SGASSLLLNPSIFLSLITFNKGFFRNNMEITALTARFRAAWLYVARLTGPRPIVCPAGHQVVQRATTLITEQSVEAMFAQISGNHVPAIGVRLGAERQELFFLF
ncbi:hypothetical protein, partial [Thiolapillus sp.]|uniref:hypothetical protein n=1 Tax=Thiolapillus sp. TaxID=2017437 RepID=UPI003AF6FCB1